MKNMKNVWKTMLIVNMKNVYLKFLCKKENADRKSVDDCLLDNFPLTYKSSTTANAGSVDW